MPSRRRQHSRQSLVRPPATPQSNRRWRRTKAIELRAAHEGRYYSIRTRCPDRRPTTEEEHVPWARCVPKLHIPPSAVGNEKSGALSPTSIGLALPLRALVAAPIWPPNRASDCSTTVKTSRNTKPTRCVSIVPPCFLIIGWSPQHPPVFVN